MIPIGQWGGRGNVEMERWVAEIKVRAARRIGELTSALDDGRGKSSTAETFKRDALKAAGLSKAAAHRCERIASLDEGHIAKAAREGRHTGNYAA